MVAGYAMPDPLVLEDGKPVLYTGTRVNIFNPIFIVPAIDEHIDHHRNIIGFYIKGMC